MAVNRRQFLSAAGALTAGAALAGCGGFTKSDSSGGGSSGNNELTFTTWASDSELVGFKNAVAGFEDANPGKKINLNVVPYEQIFQTIDAQLQSNTAPDVFRVQYYNFGAYAGEDQLLDLSKYLDDPSGSRFTPAAWAAIQNNGKPYGVPHHTDTTAILYNKSALSAAGITDIPTKVDQAWTWQQFGQVADQLRSSLPDAQYPFAYNWQKLGVTRWLSWLFEADGAMLSSDLKSSAINSDAGTAAVDFTKSFFPKRWVPQNDSIKSATYAQDVFFAGTTAMVFAGAFLLPDAAKTLTIDWGATFSPRNVRSASDLGGNALVATKGTKQPELAAQFLDYVTQEQPMRDFCVTASLLPTLKSLIASGITFKDRPDLSPIFIGQASTVKAQDAAQVASPSMNKIIPVLQDQLESAFIGGQSTADTLSNMTTGLNQALAG